ncbi:MAG: hypothetical protein AAFX39_04905, partial [Pseudomonadota bacterium]
FRHLCTKCRLATFGPILRHHWAFSKWLLLAELIIAGQEQVLWLGGGVLLGDEAVAVLRAAVFLMGGVNLVLHAVDNFVPRQAAVAHRHGGVLGLQSYLLRQTVLFSLVLGAGLLLVAGPANFWLGLVFGTAFAGTGDLVRLISFAYFLYLPIAMASVFLRTLDRTTPILWCHGAGFATVVMLGYPLLVMAGATGAAITLCLAQAVTLVAFLAACRVSQAEPLRP